MNVCGVQVMDEIMMGNGHTLHTSWMPSPIDDGVYRGIITQRGITLWSCYMIHTKGHTSSIEAHCCAKQHLGMDRGY